MFDIRQAFLATRGPRLNALRLARLHVHSSEIAELMLVINRLRIAT